MTFIFSHYRSPDRLLDHTLGQMEFPLKMGAIFRAEPQLRELAERLVWRLSAEVELPTLAERHHHLVDECLAKAYEWYSESPIRQRMSHREQRTAFAAGLFQPLMNLPFLTITVDGAEWDFITGPDLSECIARGQVVASCERLDDPTGDFSNATVRMMVLTRLYPDGGHLLLDIDVNQVYWPPAWMDPMNLPAEN